MLYTAQYVHGGAEKVAAFAPICKSTGNRGYKKHAVNHPSTLWVCMALPHYMWLCSMALALCEEHQHRFGPTARHGCEEHLWWLWNNPPPDLCWKLAWKCDPTPAMPDEYKVEGDSVESYRRFYAGSKQDRGLFKWTRRHVPHVFVPA
jgi:hypothetical protein